ncbi:MAG TPA: hypothetical protein VEX86_14945 [Longimicrobium sp.]|nr:hypothetical protein [Longimicrobium sp.]
MAYLGGLIVDPVAATDGDAWVRTDLPQPELRVWVDGVPVTLATAGVMADVNAAVAAHEGASTTVHGIMDTSNLVAFDPVECSMSLPAGGSIVLAADNDDGGAINAPRALFGQVGVAHLTVDESLAIQTPIVWAGGSDPFIDLPSGYPTVSNLSAARLEGEQGSFYLDRASHTGTQPAASLADADFSGLGPAQFDGLEAAGSVAVDAAGIALKQEGGAVVYDTLAGYGKYRQFVGRLAPQNPAFTELDWQYRVASFNWTWDPVTGAYAKEEPGDAAFQLAFESEWENHVEWNLDLTTRTDNLSHRRMGFFYDKANGNASWRFATTDGISFAVGHGDEGLASFETDAGTVKSLCLQARSNNLGYARTQAVNRAGKMVSLLITPDAGGGTIFGLSDVNLALVYADVQLAVGTSTALPLSFATNSAVRGGITSAGVWCVGSMGTTNAAAGEVLVGAGKRFSSRTSNPAVAAPLLGLDASDRTVLYLQSKPLSLQGAATAATSGAALGFIKALVGGVAVKIPYFADV